MVFVILLESMLPVYGTLHFSGIEVSYTLRWLVSHDPLSDTGIIIINECSFHSNSVRFGFPLVMWVMQAKAQQHANG